MTGTERALISAVAARRAANRTPRDVLVERLLAIAAVTMTIVISFGALKMILALV